MRRISPIYVPRCAGCSSAGLWAIVSGVKGGFYPDRAPLTVSRPCLQRSATKREERLTKPYSFLFVSPVTQRRRRRNNERPENGKSADEQTPFSSWLSGSI
ncbi:hypothetical protein XENOCAPTIV_003216 [Xenoophorus captivus]|uniref:Uncharacterized protein n=1 Tax=Xenoophorus captivus TaxID=1517983 RepID=A0ABV0SD05_9TELE